jgi:hypothetical protein
MFIDVTIMTVRAYARMMDDVGLMIRLRIFGLFLGSDKDIVDIVIFKSLFNSRNTKIAHPNTAKSL